MQYYDLIKKELSQHNYPAFLTLWEEYCYGDEIDGEELFQILTTVAKSEYAKPFGKHVDKVLDLWKMLEDPEYSHKTLKLIIDLQSINTASLKHFVLNYLDKKYGDDPKHKEKLRLLGLLDSSNTCQGAIGHYELLSHMKKGAFVFHTGGWGVGEILDVSLLREELSLELENVGGRKDFSFTNAFKTLEPIPDDHFLARRFGDADALEKLAKEDPMTVIHMLLRDLGPQSASDMKDELLDLVIPEEDWLKWWQMVRIKLKKDPMIQLPATTSGKYSRRRQEISHEERLKNSLSSNPDASELIQMVYAFLRDFPASLKNEAFKEKLSTQLLQALECEEVSDSQALQIHFILQDLGVEKEKKPVEELIKRMPSIEDAVVSMEIVAFKKRALVAINRFRNEWQPIFLNLLFRVEPSSIRDHILKELLGAKQFKSIEDKINTVLSSPGIAPNPFLWYFHKIIDNEELPYATREGKNRFFESLLILLSILEQRKAPRDLLKKIYQFITKSRYETVRKIFEHANKAEVHEFLLLATKCQTLKAHDLKIFHSLAQVVHPSLAKVGEKYADHIHEQENVIWTTEAGYIQLKERIHEIGTVETVDNAREIEAARSHGDLRENAEYKAALERRTRLQSELKLLSDQYSQARILTSDDIVTDSISVGTVIEFTNHKNKKVTYTILGPWDTNPEKGILSFQSKLAQTLIGKKVGDTVEAQGEKLTVQSIHSFLK